MADVVRVIESMYDPAWARDWDAVGLTCGDPQAPVRRVLLAVDPVDAVVEEALAWHADLLLTHHPLLLRPVHGVAAAGAKGRIVHRLIRGGCSLYTAHTNADVAARGVSDALARVLGLTDLEPLAPDALDDPEEAPRGMGRVGNLGAPTTLREFALLVAEALPATSQGVRVSGDPVAEIRRVAVCGGAGDSLFGAVRASGADAYVTADLRHHPASEAREEDAGGSPYLVDVAHWASEWPWLAGVGNRLQGELERLGTPVEIHVSNRSTDPWTFRVPSPGGVMR
ncbi:MAG: Nif3-like dinuclear metal center hexameric protein [Actinomycetota bacterium]|nr:Nif3-like dinuclear metal center hexameric protein [Actinomycetota bacterium]